MKLIDTNQDRWTEPRADAPVDLPVPAPHLLLSLADWQQLRVTWPAGVPVGVVLPNDAAPGDIAADLPRLALVALQFPKWTDGRAYSQAHLLRSRHGYRGEVRATGEVLVDMLPLLQRTGVDAAVLRPDQSPEVARRVLGHFGSHTAHYQGDVIDPRPRFAREAA